jgi:hypothetical protein
VPAWLGIPKISQGHTLPERSIGEVAVPVSICFEAETGEVNIDPTQVLVPNESTSRLLRVGAQTVERRVQARDVERIAHQD